MSTQTQQLNATANTQLSFTSPNAALAKLLRGSTLALGFSSGPFTLASQQSLNLGPAARSASASADPAALLAISESLAAPGGGSFLLNCSSLTGAAVSGAGPTSFGLEATAACGARVTYTYQPTVTPVPVPLPGTAALACMGMLILALVKTNPASSAQRGRVGARSSGLPPGR